MRDKRTDSAAPAQPSEQGRAASSAERSLRARLAAYAMHAQRDSRQTSAPGRAAFLARFEREVDPDSTLDPEERQRRAAQARSAYFTRLSLRAVQARKARRQRRSQDGEAA
jgi:hypothetical protein